MTAAAASFAPGQNVAEHMKEAHWLLAADSNQVNSSPPLSASLATPALMNYQDENVYLGLNPSSALAARASGTAD